jgi:hypothetical protein
LPRGAAAAGFHLCAWLDANVVLDVLHAPAAIDDVLDGVLHLPFRYRAFELDVPFFDVDAHLADVDRLLLRQAFADEFTDALIRAGVVLRAASAASYVLVHPAGLETAAELSGLAAHAGLGKALLRLLFAALLAETVLLPKALLSEALLRLLPEALLAEALLGLLAEALLPLLAPARLSEGLLPEARLLSEALLRLLPEALLRLLLAIARLLLLLVLLPDAALAEALLRLLPKALRTVPLLVLLIEAVLRLLSEALLLWPLSLLLMLLP